MPFNQRNEGSKSLSMTWRTISIRRLPAGGLALCAAVDERERVWVAALRSNDVLRVLGVVGVAAEGAGGGLRRAALRARGSRGGRGKVIKLGVAREEPPAAWALQLGWCFRIWADSVGGWSDSWLFSV